MSTYLKNEAFRCETISGLFMPYDLIREKFNLSQGSELREGQVVFTVKGKAFELYLDDFPRQRFLVTRLKGEKSL